MNRINKEPLPEHLRELKQKLEAIDTLMLINGIERGGRPYDSRSIPNEYKPLTTPNHSRIKLN